MHVWVPQLRLDSDSAAMVKLADVPESGSRLRPFLTHFEAFWQFDATHPATHLAAQRNDAHLGELAQEVCVCVYYCSTYYKAVRVGGG